MVIMSVHVGFGLSCHHPNPNPSFTPVIVPAPHRHSFCETLQVRELSSSFRSDSLRPYSVRSLPNVLCRRRERLSFRSWSFHGDRCESRCLAACDIKTVFSHSLENGFAATLVHLETTTVGGWRLDCRLPDCGHCHHVPFLPQSVGYGYRVRSPLRITHVVLESEC